MKRALLVTLHYPPFAASSGYRRTLKFAQGLPAFGWQPVVLTAHPDTFRADQLASGESPPPEVEVLRARALDTRRDLSIAGRYPMLLALPDRWWTWWFDAVRLGLRAIRNNRVDAIFSTYPIPTAHLVGMTLSRLGRRPWVADFRDPMVDELVPEHREERAVRGWLEHATLRRCARAVFTAEGTRELYRSRYRDIPADRLTVIPNGFDEESFVRAEASAATRPGSGRPLRLLHSGLLYSDVRNPRHLFEALADLVTAGTVRRDDLRIVLRACGPEALVYDLACKAGVEDMIEIVPALPYVKALREMLDADGLLLIQGRGANHQVPAKLYEYLRAGRPILALCDPESDTARTLREARTGTTARLDDRAGIAARLQTFLAGLANGTESGCERAHADQYSRTAGVAALGAILDKAAGAPSATHADHRI